MKFLLAHKKFLVGILALAGLSFMIGFFNRYHLPKIKNWLLVEVESYSQQHLPLGIWPQSVEFHFFPIGATFHDVRVQPKKEISHLLAPTTIAETELRLSFFGFLQGRLELGSVTVRGADLKLFVRKATTPTKATDVKFSKELLAQIPVQSIFLENISTWVRDENLSMSFQSPKIDLGVEKRSGSVSVELAAEALKIKKTDDTSIFEADVETKIHVTENEITLSRVKIQKDDSFLISSGWMEWEASKNKFNRIVSRSRASLKMPDVEVVLKEFFPKSEVPDLRGRVAFEVQSDHTFGKKLQGDFKVQTQDLKISHYTVGKLTASGKVDEKRAQFDSFQVQHPGGRASLKDFDFNIVEPYGFKAQVVGNQIDVHSLLNGLGIQNVPVFSDLDPTLNCSGQIQNFNLKCEGKAQVPSVLVKSGMRAEKPIVLLKNGSLNGKLEVDLKKVTYQTQIKLPNSVGSSKGEISYEKGFKISYDTDQLNLSDVNEISGITFSGQARVHGTTEGNSRTGKIDMKVVGENLTLDQFGLGKVTTEIRYRKGILSFNDTKGQHRSTQYTGQLALNFNEDTIFLDARSPFVDMENVMDLLSSKWKIPFEVTGTGSAHFKMRGPMTASKMSFDLDASLYRGVIANETYDQFQLTASAKDGRFETKKVSLTKGPGLLTAQATGRFDGEIKGLIKGRGFRIEQSENLNRMDLKVAGILSTDIEISGKTQSPDFKAAGQLTNATISDLPVANTSFSVRSDLSSLSGDATFGEKVVLLSGAYDWEQNGRFSLSGEFNNWNFSQAFSAFSDSLRANAYSAKLDGKFRFQGEKSNLDNLSGNLEFKTLEIQNGESSIGNTKPMLLDVDKGVIKTQNFYLAGGDNFLRLDSKQSRAKKLDLSLEGKLDLKLISLLAPFLEDIQGRLHVAMAVNGSISSPVVSGNTYIENGFLRFRGFPHPLEQLSSDIIFDQNKIIINSVKSRLAGGTVAASGQVLLNKISDVVVDVRGQFLDTTFQMPPGFTTRGSGNFSVKGNWFPYLVSVDYDIVSGKVDREIKTTGSDQKEIEPSTYLPKFLAEKRFSPVNLNLEISIPPDFPVHLVITRLDISAKVNGKLKVNGPPERPLLTGRIQIARGGKVVFRNNVFEVLNGYVEYRNSPPEDPYLNVTAESRVSVTNKDPDDGTERIREFDVALRVLGSASQPEVTVSSQPPLSQSELISLLTLGFINQPEQTDAERAGALTNTSYQLGSAFLNEQLGLNKEIGKRLGVEFDFSSGFDATDNAAVHTFTVKKQWTPKFGTSASRSVGKTNTNNVRAEYKINNNLSVIGNYEGKEQVGSSEGTTEDIEPNLFGVDVEYKVEFK